MILKDSTIEICGLEENIAQAEQAFQDIIDNYAVRSYAKNVIFIQCLKSMDEYTIYLALFTSQVTAG